MKAGKAKDKAKAGTSPQLDLFALPSKPAAEQVVFTTAQTIEVRTPKVDGSSPRPGQDPLVDFLFGKPRGRGRPEKTLISNDVPEDGSADNLVDVREAARRLGLSKSTLDKMRCSGRGPLFIRATDRSIRYDPKDLRAFRQQRRRRTTSELAGLLTE